MKEVVQQDDLLRVLRPPCWCCARRRSDAFTDDGDLPVIEGTLIRLQAGHLPGDRDPKPVWLWSSRAGADPAAMDRLRQGCWQAVRSLTSLFWLYSGRGAAYG